ncbi:MAG: hypothetical protein WHT84_05450 [Breznakiellaceae bacterium]
MENRKGIRGPEEKHAEFSLVYPVYSRRSGGLSLGINLFLSEKVCSFDCPYCEVFPPVLPEQNLEKDFPFGASGYGSPNVTLSSNERDAFLISLEQQLRHHISLLDSVKGEGDAPSGRRSIRDISFSGNGEPTLSPFFVPALEMVHRVRMELVPSAALVLITNGTGFLRPEIFDALMAAACGEPHLDIWLKVDGATDDWFHRMSGSAIPRESLHEAFLRFAACAPFTVQTMVCSIDGALPPDSEVIAWEHFILRLCQAGQNEGGKESPERGSLSPASWEKSFEKGALSPASGEKGASLSCLQDTPPVRGPRRVHLYGKARPSPHDPRAGMAPPSYLEKRAASLRQFLQQNGYAHIPVEVFL